MALLGLFFLNASRNEASFSVGSSSGDATFAREKTMLRKRNRAKLQSCFQICAILLLALFAAPQTSYCQSAEFKLKAVYLFNFIQFTDWPETAFANEKSPLIIGVLGNDPFGKALDETVRGEVLKNRPLVIRRYKNINEIKECHVLYISTSETSNRRSILAELRGRSILTVSDMEDFAITGGIIKFIRKDNKIGFRINTEAAKAANLSISSKLLQLAEVISNDKR